MTISPQTSPPAMVAYAFNQGIIGNLGSVSATGTSKPGEARLSHFRFRQKVYPWEGGMRSLRLFHEPEIKLDRSTVKISIEKWGIELNIGDAPQLPKYIVRRFLELWQKAQSARLTDSEADCWLWITDSVDLKGFEAQQVQPRYVEGRLISKAEQIVISWHDCSESRIGEEFREAFDLVESGEDFSAFVKFGEATAIVAVERVMPLVN